MRGNLASFLFPPFIKGERGGFDETNDFILNPDSRYPKPETCRPAA